MFIDIIYAFLIDTLMSINVGGDAYIDEYRCNVNVCAAWHTLINIDSERQQIH